MTKHTQPAHTNQREMEWEKDLRYIAEGVRELIPGMPSCVDVDVAIEFIRTLLQAHDATLLARIEEMKGYEYNKGCKGVIDDIKTLIQKGDNEK